jgi:hypothetical protein
MVFDLTRPVYKPHSVRQVLPPRRSSILARRLRLARAAYPKLTETSSLPGQSAHLSLLGLAPDGGYLAAPVARRAGGLLHHLFTLASTHLHEEVGEGGSFLWPDPAGNRFSPAPSRELPGIALCGVRTFLYIAVASYAAIARPTWSYHHTIFQFSSQSSQWFLVVCFHPPSILSFNNSRTSHKDSQPEIKTQPKQSQCNR